GDVSRTTSGHRLRPRRDTASQASCRHPACRTGRRSCLVAPLEGVWPTAVRVDHLVDLGHQADGFLQGDHDLVVVGNVVVAEGAAFAVLEPFLADLVAADVEVPYVLGYRTETAGTGSG